MGKNTGGKRTLRGDLIERRGSSEAWDEESQPPGGKGPLRPHVIVRPRGSRRVEAGGSTEGWYGEPPGIRTEPGLFRDACCDSRCSRPAGLFSLGLLDVPQGTPPSPSLPSSPGGLRPQLSRDGLPE